MVKHWGKAEITWPEGCKETSNKPVCDEHVNAQLQNEAKQHVALCVYEKITRLLLIYSLR